MQNDTILKTCLNLFRFNMIRIVTIQYDSNCYDSYDSQTCLNLFRFNMIWIVTIQYDTNCYDSYDSQTCLNLFRFKWFIWFSNMSKRILNCNTKFCKIWVNGTKCKDKKENARTKRKMQGRHKKWFLGSLRASRAIKNIKNWPSWKKIGFFLYLHYGIWMVSSKSWKRL